ncbi:MAG: hypothetical protein WC420_01345 [Candidatus Paceibacterota bacterium]
MPLQGGLNMNLINQVKKIINERKRMRPQVFSRIKESEETMRMIDTLRGKYRYQGEDWNWSCAWYELYKLAESEIRDDVFSLAMGRINDIQFLSHFYHCSEQKHAEAACKKGLTLAKTFGNFEWIARSSPYQETMEKAIKGALAVAASSNDCSNIIGRVMKWDIENSDALLKQTIERGVALAKNLHSDIDNLRCSARWYGDPPQSEKQKRDLILAQNMLKSKLRFEHKRQLRNQVNLCERRGSEELEALDALVTSIIWFDEYERLCTTVPKGQRKLLAKQA